MFSVKAKEEGDMAAKSQLELLETSMKIIQVSTSSFETYLDFLHTLYLYSVKNWPHVLLYQNREVIFFCTTQVIEC